MVHDKSICICVIKHQFLCGTRILERWDSQTRSAYTTPRYSILGLKRKRGPIRPQHRCTLLRLFDDVITALPLDMQKEYLPVQLHLSL